MEFVSQEFDKILPGYLGSSKDRLKEALGQFSIDRNDKAINYSNFYRDFGYSYFLQSDLIKDIRCAKWDSAEKNFKKVFIDAIIISNSCDISAENKHTANQKECLFAPIIELEEFLEDLRAAGYNEDQLNPFVKEIKAQKVTNLFYLPAGHKNGEYVAFLDKMFWFPTFELNSYANDIEQNRITSLDYFGHYLFILKVSYHLCRLPEEQDRKVPAIS